MQGRNDLIATELFMRRSARRRNNVVVHKQVLRAYPQFVEFLKLKKKYDPGERFQSDWYRHYKAMFAEELKM